jgi:membrane protein implicated in regulation of membrane protease activity
MELFSQIDTLHWLILGLALVGLEVIAPSSYLMWPGASALVVGLLSALIGSLGVKTEFVIFAILAVASSVLWHRYFKKQTEETDRPQLNRRAMQYIGRKIVLREAFVDGTGSLVIDDSRWRAEAESGQNLETGTRVEVFGVEGVTLKVKALPEEPEPST